jgi:hypothetical protein
MAEGILSKFFGRGDSSLLFFFLLLVIIFCNCKLFTEGSELLFFFLILVIVFSGSQFGGIFGADAAVEYID